ncbi:MAG: DNA repair protein RecN [Alphaproteobacteria bacterium]|nr:DNA repair protein RecN [Alphaproteobacteria bacterium]
MLKSLSIRDIVLIQKLDLEFSDGLTVLTGETGAGKSILLDSLSLALGARGDTALVRPGAKEASVTACFEFSVSHPVGALLSAQGYDFDGGLIIRRILGKDGRSRAFLNDTPVSVGFLKTIGDSLVEIHGQFASHKLLNPATHRETLDSYGNIGEKLIECRHAFEQWQYRIRERSDTEKALIRAKEEEDFLRKSVQDLEKLDPHVDEEEALVARRTRLMNSEKIVTALGSVYQSLSDEDSGSLKILGEALSQLERADDLSGGDLKKETAQLAEALTSISDLAQELEQIQEKWGDVSELPAIDDRLFALRDMARKHQVSISELPDLLDKFKKELTGLELGEDALTDLMKQEGQARLDYISKAEELSHLRTESAIRLDTAVEGELPALKLGKATFKTDIQKLNESEWMECGFDKVSFLVSTNKGMPLSPIHKIASGGELARFMLALKVNLSTADEIETLVFDEVDSGVGGAVADAVGARLKQLAHNHQVLVVTHSPQVAAYGGSHFKVQKEEKSEGVLTSVSVLFGDSRQEEIARMLSGEKITKTALTMAGELLDTCLKK